MAIKIFCNSCQKYIRDAKPGEISSLRGTEVCAECEQSYSELIKKVQKLAAQATNKINTAVNSFMAEAEEAKRHVITPEE